MIRTMKVDLQCPKCDDGVLTVTLSPDQIEDVEDAGCGHGELLATGPMPTELADSIWKLAGEKEADLYDAEMESRGDRLRDGGD